MDYLKQTTSQISRNVWWLVCGFQLATGLLCYLGYSYMDLSPSELLALWLVLSCLGATAISRRASHMAAIPLEAVQEAILHVSPSTHGVAAPKLENIRIGRAYVTNVARQIYEIVGVQTDQDRSTHRTQATQSSTILAHLPLPLFVFSKEQRVTFASDTALNYVGIESTAIFGKSLYEAIDLEFSSDFTLESWVADCQQNKATDTAYWRRVRVHSKSNPNVQKQCDIAGSYSRENSEGIEFVITLFDHTDEYDQDDQSMNFIALAVHELRTPLTIMRGYIEAFEDELGGKLDPTTTQYMIRLQASARQLSSFVNNILNVARIQENQLAVKLRQENWPDIISRVCRDMEIQASARDITITQLIEDNIPPVGVDPTTIYEVLTNLIENAIKYSNAASQKEIIVSAKLGKDGMVETSVQDHGVGIPASVLPTLFEKFHRNHRNQMQISGTGLGLYICKAIIDAHDGSIWVNSTEGKGSTFSFTVNPYQSLATNLKRGDNTDMTRTAHGWIKNHSLYRK